LRSKEKYYDILGVAKGASEEEIKAAYKKLVLRWHPDRNNNSAESSEMFKKLNLAYESVMNGSGEIEEEFVRAASSDTMRDLFREAEKGEDEFVSAFSNLFGEYLDQKIPGGFRGRVNEVIRKEEKRKKNYSSGRQRREERQPGESQCPRCGGSGFVFVQQGGWSVKIKCTQCGS